MRILLVADDLDDSLTVETALTADGHEVVCCHDEFGGPCRGLDHVEACPLERHVDLAVVARAGTSPRGLGEMGAVCASRHRIGVVEIDPEHPLDESVADMHARVERNVCHAYERAVIRDLEEGGIDGVFVTVGRSRGMVRVVVSMDPARHAAMDPFELARLVDRVGRASRRHDRFAPTIDVLVQSS